MQFALKSNQTYTTSMFVSYYFLQYFGFGALYPFLTVYLTKQGLSGSQLGILISIPPVIMIFAQPFWGILADYTKKTKLILFFTILCSAIIGYVLHLIDHYVMLIVGIGLLSFFQSSMIPLTDSITVSYVQKVKYDYGFFRLWGSVGFAVSVFIVGRISESYGLTVIFYTYSLTLFVCALLTYQFPIEGDNAKINLKDGVSELIKIPKFTLFLLATFLVYGPVFSNGSYFGLFITNQGGTLAGVGTAFLIAAGSEAPIMKMANQWIRKVGVLKILLISSAIALLRWTFYYFEPPLYLVYFSTIAQGFANGLGIPAALQYVTEIVPSKMRITAISLYTTVGAGVGSWFCIFVGGFILEKYTVSSVYGFFSLLGFLGCILIFMINLLEKNKRVAIRDRL
ncbi:MFS transporter [Neobacillus cucumis]|uniref:MFS transporter n=1 Tax=Neobacillus cucumis TaxID=1740721 RepID=UPI001965B62D|nr:MFS transporter [Neobacillus cucumis]MBM7652264.1 PPP family 3-phenylpropionic acid transporter [Neobacillus cucumis]